MARAVVTVDSVTMCDTVMRVLRDFKEDGGRAIDKAVSDEADEIRTEIRKNARSAGFTVRNTGKHYISGWQIKKSRRHGMLTCTIYNGSKPGLAHLLENGHRVKPIPKKAGRKTEAKAFPHIMPALDGMEADLMDKIETNLGMS